MRRLTALPSLLALFLFAGDISVASGEEIDWALDKRISALEKRIEALERKSDVQSAGLVVVGPSRVTVGDFAYDQYPDGRMVLVPRVVTTTTYVRPVPAVVTTPEVVVRQGPFVRSSVPVITPVTLAPPVVGIRTYSPAVVRTAPTLTPVRNVVQYGITNLSGGCENGRCSLR